jgi:hypothetical protein
MCPSSKRIKLYIQQWGMTNPSHYVILHKVEHPTARTTVFKLACARLLSCTLDSISLIDGVLMQWPDPNPKVACGQTPILTRIMTAGASTLSAEILSSPELQRELRMAADVANLYGSPKEYSVWTKPGKAVFSVPDTECGEISVTRIRPYATNVTKPNVILWGDVSNNALPDAPELQRHIIPQIKNAEPFITDDPLLTRMLRFALETRLLPYIAVSRSMTRGDIYALTCDSESETFVAQIATNHKVTGLPQVIRYNNEGADVYVPDLVLAGHLKTLFFDRSGGDTVYASHVHTLRGLLKTMGYSTWEHISLAMKNWHVTLTLEEDEALEAMRLEHGS